MTCRKAKQEEEVIPEVLLPMRKWCLLLLFLFSCSNTYANPFKQHIEQDIQRYSQQQNWPTYDHDITLWLPNKMTDLPYCKSAIHYQRTTPNNAPVGRVNYAISCPQPSWKMKAYAKVKIWLYTWHAKVDINKGHILKPEDIQLQKTLINRSTQRYISRDQKVLNLQAKRYIRAGKIILPRQLQQQLSVKRGDEVIIRAGTGGFVVSMKGKALKNGSVGDKIYIKNLSSGKKIQAKIIESGIVEPLF